MTINLFISIKQITLLRNYAKNIKKGSINIDKPLQYPYNL